MDAVIELLKLGSVGLIAGLFSAYIAIRGHRNKKWWELRVEAYKSIIEALSDLTYYFDRKYELAESSEQSRADLEKLWDDNYHKVRKAADSGAFLFSEEVNLALKEFRDLRNIDHQDYFDYLDSYSCVAKKCLKSIVSSANKDLRVKDTWL